MENTEVEQKYQLVGDAQKVRDLLKGVGAEPGEPSHQIDTYYNAPHRDFLAPDVISEWLRVRIEDGSASLTFKRCHFIDGIMSHCDEFETTVADSTAVTHILSALDYTEIAVVDKVREEWTTSDGDIAVAFDEVAGLGAFVEFEFKGAAGSVKTATARLEEFIASLGASLGDRVHAGYPRLALDRGPRRGPGGPLPAPRQRCPN
ncbi:class IV adenylate cyclase [Streptomyces solisilvae]|uniref:class IV adenylate cyclase n=1 Tax=Streptomyces malaysiensis TaxID=92644 RepID=UPI0036B2A610